MMYPLMPLSDGTELVRSDFLPNGKIKVYVEKPDEKVCFHSAVYLLPDELWQDIKGFTDGELDLYKSAIESIPESVFQISNRKTNNNK